MIQKISHKIKYKKISKVQEYKNTLKKKGKQDERKVEKIC